MASEADVAWAAGLFEGEGYCGVARHFDKRRLRLRHDPTVKLAMTDEDVVRRFHRVVGVGRVRVVVPTPPRKTNWYWQASSRDEVLHVLGLLWPFLGHRRREAATEVIECAVKRRDGDWRLRPNNGRAV